MLWDLCPMERRFILRPIMVAGGECMSRIWRAEHLGACRPLISLKPSHFETSLVSPDGRFVFARDLSGKGGLYPIAGGEPRGLPGWTPDDIWITWSADGHSAYVYHDDKTSALVYLLDLANGKRELVATLFPGDSAG